MREELITDFAEVTYKAEDSAVFLVWKNRAILEDYREPTLFALELLQKHNGSNFIVDARNGFEDDKRDVEWGFSYLLPEMSRTSCRFIVFIMNEINEVEIGEEMDMWTAEFGKYFAVTKSKSYEEAVESTKHFLQMNVKYYIQSGKREEFYQKVVSEKIDLLSRQEPGNVLYEYAYLAANKDVLCLSEAWVNASSQKRHTSLEHFARLQKLKDEYVVKTEIDKFFVEKIDI